MLCKNAPSHWVQATSISTPNIDLLKLNIIKAEILLKITCNLEFWKEKNVDDAS